MVWNRVKEQPILRSSSILASTDRDSFQSGRTSDPNAFRMAASVMDENLARYTVCQERKSTALSHTCRMYVSLHVNT